MIRVFPINSRHQEVATFRPGRRILLELVQGFQSIAATKKWRRPVLSYGTSSYGYDLFPINSRHQEVATWNAVELREMRESDQFPINSRHQEVAT